MLLVNFKAYENGVGSKAVHLAKIIESEARKVNVKAVVAVQAADIYRVSNNVGIDVVAQHLDPIKYGAFTGYVLPEGVKNAGGKGSLLNHSEFPLNDDVLKRSIEDCRRLKLTSYVCSPSISDSVRIARMDPDYIAFEVPELIGSGKAISREMPDSVLEFIDKVREVNKRVNLLCGAGITNKEDVKAAIELGVKGVLVASAIVKASNPREVVREMLKELKS